MSVCVCVYISFRGGGFNVCNAKIFTSSNIWRWIENMPIFKRKIQCARRFNSRVCLYAFQIAMHYVIQFDGERRGDTKPMQKWWLKLKLPIEHEQEEGRERETGEGDTKNMEQTRIRGGKIDSYWNTLFSIICRPFWKCRITQTRYRFRHDKYIIVRLRR